MLLKINNLQIEKIKKKEVIKSFEAIEKIKKC
jgi:hypothetical protein